VVYRCFDPLIAVHFLQIQVLALIGGKIMIFRDSQAMDKKPHTKRAKPIVVISLAISTVFALQAPAAHADLIPQDPLVITSTSGLIGVPLVLTYSGGSGTGDVYFFNMEKNCTTMLVNGEWLLTLDALNRSGLPVCDDVVVGRNGDTTYDSARSVPIDITFTEGHGVKPQLPTVLTSVIDKVGQPHPITYSSVSTLVIARSEKAKSVRQNTP
jgi:hypothetical protein